MKSFVTAALFILSTQAARAGGPAWTTEYAADVAWGDGVYLVTWIDVRNSDGPEIYAARVTPGGVVLDPDGIRIAPGSQVYPQAVGFGAGVFLVVWHEQTSPAGVRAARISPAGIALDTVPIVVSSSTLTYWSHPQPTFDGAFCSGSGEANFLVTWHDDRDGKFRTYAARVSPSGTVLDPEGFVVSRRECSWEWCAIVTGGGVSLLAWTDRGHPRWSIYAARVTPDGTVLDTSAIPVGVDSAGVWSPAIAFDGVNFLVATSYFRGEDVFGVFVTPGGALVDTPFALIRRPRAQYRVDVAFDGENYFAVWEDCGTNPYGVMGTRVTPGGVVLDPLGIAVDTGPGVHRTPKVAFDGTNYLVTWNDDRVRQNDYDVYAARVTPGGVVLDSGGFPVSARVGVKEGKWGRPAGIGKRQPTVVRGVLRMPRDTRLGTQRDLPERDLVVSRAVLLDVSGREVMALRPGDNNVRHLAPGVYFVHSTFDTQHSALATKVVVTR